MNIGANPPPAKAIDPDTTHVFHRPLQHHLPLALSSLGYGHPARGRRSRP